MNEVEIKVKPSKGKHINIVPIFKIEKDGNLGMEVHYITRPSKSVMKKRRYKNK